MWINHSNFSKKLSEYLQPSLPPTATHLNVNYTCILKAQGRTSTVYSFTLTYLSNGLKQRKDFVLKVYNKESASHARKEFAMLKTLKKNGIAVPDAYYLKENDEILGKNFLIMERIAAEPVSQNLEDEGKAQFIVDKMAKLLRSVHNLDPSCIENFKLLHEQYKTELRGLLEVMFFIKKTYRSYFSFSSPLQKRFAAAVYRLRAITPEKYRSAILHGDYKPDHILASNKELAIVDWGIASVGDPSYDIAYSYHRLRIGRETDKIDLGERFVKAYENCVGQKLINLQFCKDIVAIWLAMIYGLSPFKIDKLWNIGKLVDLTFGSPLGRLMWAIYLPKQRRIVSTQDYQEKQDCIHKYVIQYLEKGRYDKR
jgi:aminoglycoside phosphotransferase (APT) family kinase protein